jgi:hypothetical protein
MGNSKGGRPKTEFELGLIKFKPRRQVKIKMSDRVAVERFCTNMIDCIQTDLAAAKDDLRTLLDVQKKAMQLEAKEGKVNLSLMAAFERLNQRYRQLVNDQAKQLTSLMKQYALFSTLDRPEEDDPKYTPVEFYVDDPPDEAIVQNKYVLGPEDVDPERPDHPDAGKRVAPPVADESDEDAENDAPPADDDY